MGVGLSKLTLVRAWLDDLPRKSQKPLLGFLAHCAYSAYVVHNGFVNPRDFTVAIAVGSSTQKLEDLQASAQVATACRTAGMALKDIVGRLFVAHYIVRLSAVRHLSEILQHERCLPDQPQ